MASGTVTTIKVAAIVIVIPFQAVKSSLDRQILERSSVCTVEYSSTVTDMIENYGNVAKFCRKLLCRYDEPTISMNTKRLHSIIDITFYINGYTKSLLFKTSTKTKMNITYQPN